MLRLCGMERVWLQEPLTHWCRGCAHKRSLMQASFTLHSLPQGIVSRSPNTACAVQAQSAWVPSTHDHASLPAACGAACSASYCVELKTMN
jgi:hypothetical protein